MAAVLGVRSKAVALVAGVAACVLGSAYIGSMSRERILHADATLAGETWGRHLAERLPDLEQALAGQEPSPESSLFLAQAKQVGHIFRYKLFDRDGRVRYVSDEGRWDRADVRNLSDHNAFAAAVVAKGEPFIATRNGDGVSRPHLFTSAYVPLTVNERRIGTVEIYLDQTQRSARLSEELALIALKINALVALAFAAPMGAVFWQARRRREAAERLVHLANHDTLTGLMNRAAITARIAGCYAEGRSFAVHFIDLDRFKDINDTLGHGTGDALLKAVATRLHDVIGDDACLGRLGGDEFALLQPLAAKGDHAGDAARLANRIVNALAVPLPLGEHDVQIGASVGTALAGLHGRTPEGLLKSADIALYQAKRGGRGRAVSYDPSMEVERHERLQLEQCLRDAVAHDRFELAYQPLYDTDGLKLRGFEALLRMSDQAGKPISPAVFIPLAEEMGLIDRIGRWVLREACRTAALWPDDIRIAVNLSPQQFESGQIIAEVAAILAETGLAPQRLELEVTESLLLNDVDSVIAQLEGLKSLGVSIALDDFGTGYSSLSYLWRFPFDKLKVDRSFMEDISDRSSKSREVLDTIIALGRVLELRVTAEGVETCAQAEALRELKCDQLQGFLFGRPQPATEVAATILRGVAAKDPRKLDSAEPPRSNAA